MTFKQGLMAARTSLLMIAAFVTGLAAIAMLERWEPARRVAAFEPAPDIPAARPRVLTERERRWAWTAWRYFERNVHADTGLAHAVDQHPAATLWDTGSYLMAVISAERLGLISLAEFDSRVARALDSLAKVSLYEGEAPNKSYNTITLAMVGHDNQPTTRGTGWSAIDIGRFLVPCNVLAWRYPQHTAAVRVVLSRWNFSRLARDGVLYGAADAHGKTVHRQEGRLGYEEYGAKPFALAGFDVREAQRVDDFLRFVDVDGVQVAVDSRQSEGDGAHDDEVSEPYILDGLEFGFDRTSRELAWRVVRAQEARFRKTGVLTAVSTKAAFGWHALYATAYTRQLVERVEQLFDPDKGWYSGVDEATGKPNETITANTNAIVLESLCYTQTGQLMKPY